MIVKVQSAEYWKEYHMKESKRYGLQVEFNISAREIWKIER